MENQGNLREFAKLLREFLKTEKYQGILRELALADLSTSSEKCYIVSLCLPSVFKPPSCMETYVSFQYTKTQIVFKVTCDAHVIVKLALQSENALAPLASWTCS